MAGRKLKRQSQVWMHFKKGDDKICECLICGRNIRTCGNTTNLRSHLKTHKINLSSDLIITSVEDNKHYIRSETESKKPCMIEVLDDFLVFPKEANYLSESEEIQDKNVEFLSKDDPLYQPSTDEEDEEINSYSENKIEAKEEYNDQLNVKQQKITYKPYNKLKKETKTYKTQLKSVNKSPIKRENNISIKDLQGSSPVKFQQKDDFDRIGEIVSNRLRGLNKKLSARKCENEILTIILSYELEEEDEQMEDY